MRPREIKRLAQIHMAGKWHNWDLNPGSLTPEAPPAAIPPHYLWGKTPEVSQLNAKGTQWSGAEAFLEVTPELGFEG